MVEVEPYAAAGRLGSDCKKHDGGDGDEEIVVSHVGRRSVCRPAGTARSLVSMGTAKHRYL
jgi:hypothetical protein